MSRFIKFVPKLFGIAFVLTFLFFGVSGAHADGTVAVSGTVTDQNNATVEVVSIYVTNPGSSTVIPYPATTSVDGSYRLYVAPGTYDVHFVPSSVSGYNPLVDSDVTITADQTLNAQLTPLQDSHTLSGYLYDANGNPISGAPINYINVNTQYMAGTITNSSGFYSMTVAPGVLALIGIGDPQHTVNGFEYFSTSNLTYLGPNYDLTNTDVTAQPISLPKFYNVNVALLDQGGNPVAGDTVEYTIGKIDTYLNIGQNSVSAGGAYESPAGNNINTITSNSNGETTFSVPFGTEFPQADGSNNFVTNICATSQQGALTCMASPLTVTGDTSVVIPVYNPALHNLSGYVFDGNGYFVTNETIIYTNISTGSVYSTNTNSNGYYSMALPSGTYSFTSIGGNGQGNGFEYSSEPGQPYFNTDYYTITSSNVGAQPIFLPAFANINVTLLDQAGNPISGAVVNYSLADSTMNPTLYLGHDGVTANTSYVSPKGNSIYSAITGSNGTATFAVPVGTVIPQGSDICATGADGVVTCMASSLTVTGVESIVLQQQPSSYTFSGVLSDSNGNLLGNCYVSLQDGQGDYGTTETDYYGNFSISVKPGMYALDVRSVSYEDGMDFDVTQPVSNPTINLTSGNIVQNLTLDIVSLNVMVYDSQGYIPRLGGEVYEDANDGSTSLYQGDPGENIETVANEYGSIDTDTGIETVNTILGTTYLPNNYSLYAGVNNPPYEYVSLSTPFTVTSNNETVIIPGLPSAPNYFSGYITDSNGNPIAGVDVQLLDAYENLSQVVTGSNGYYNIPVEPGMYSLDIGDQQNDPLDGISDFELAQDITKPTIDLTSGNVNLNLQLQTVTITVTAYDANGNIIPYDAYIMANATHGTSTLYPGDPGENIGIGEVLSYGGYTNAQGQANVASVIGAVYTTAGNDGNIWEEYNQGNTWVQLAQPLTVTGNMSVAVPQGPIVVSAPTLLNITSPTTAPVLIWNSVAGASSYNIYRGGVLVGNTANTTFTDNSAPLGWDTYNVTAVENNVESILSNDEQAFVGTVPVITSGASASVGMRTPFDFTVTTTGYPNPVITETGTLPAGMTFIDNGDGTADLSGTAAVGTAGTYTITITANNGIGAPATQTFTLTITPANSAPTFLNDSSDLESVLVPFSFTINTSGYPAPKITKTGALPGGVTFLDNGNGTATISGTPANGSDGVYTITLTAKSTAGTVTQTFTLTVTKAPVITKIPTKTAHVGTLFTMTVTAKGYLPPTLTEVGALPAGLSFVDNGNGTATIAGTPNVGDGGAYTITIYATNELGTTSQTFTLKVDEAPTILSADTATAVIGQAFSFSIVDAGFPDPTMTKVGTLPKGITFSAATESFSGTAKAGTAGTYVITITVKNSTASYTQNFILIVT